MKNKNKMRIIIFLVFYVNYSWTREVDYCFVDETNPYHWFGTKTPYRYVTNGKIEQPRMPNCKPVQIWMFARHATRYPQSSEIKKFKKLPKIRNEIVRSHESKGRGHLCEEDIENLKKWMPLPNASVFTSDIATEGRREGRELGRIYKDAFPSLLEPSGEEINSENYVFNARRERRAEFSMYAFMEGLFGSQTLVEPTPFSKPNYLLEPDKNCPLWLHSILNPKNSEIRKFIRGPDYVGMRINVSRRLGFNVTIAQIRNMKDMCRYETAWIRNHTSPWCGIFIEQEWKILEYLDDMRSYYHASNYGFKTNGLLSCFVVQDMFENFRKIENGETNGKPKAIFHFSHEKLSLSLLSVLGIGRDSQILRADNYRELADRKWRTSFLAPFFSNFLATFYRCNDSSSSNKVTFHLQEKLVMLDGCENGICDWDYLKTKFSKSSSQCMKDCADKENVIANVNLGIVLLISVSAIILIVMSLRLFLNELNKKPKCSSIFIISQNH